MGAESNEKRKIENDRKRFSVTLENIPSDVYTLLDCGARYGTFAELVSKKYPVIKTTSFDLEPRGEGVLQGSITNIPFPDKSFDIITALEILEHLDDGDLHCAVNEISRVAKKYVLVTVPYQEWPLDCGSGHLQLFTKRRLRKLVKAKDVSIFEILECGRYVGFRKILLHIHPRLVDIYCHFFGYKTGKGPIWIGAIFRI
ncbi:MAG: class I SAM-dependent methyltransferase [Candidatus Thermoplasmatota archaeon]|nr:class I SAM-dependent methyltransferase [Candidatus Thermoplasmatota archaeon]